MAFHPSCPSKPALRHPPARSLPTYTPWPSIPWFPACLLTWVQDQFTARHWLFCTSLRQNAASPQGRAQSLLFFPTSGGAEHRTQQRSPHHTHTHIHNSSAQAGSSESPRPGGDPDTIAGLQNRVCPALSSRVHKVQWQPNSQRNATEPCKPGEECVNRRETCHTSSCCLHFLICEMDWLYKLLL